MTRLLSFAFLGLMLLVPAAAQTTQPADYEPAVPKVSVPVEKLLVLDVRQDMLRNDDGPRPHFSVAHDATVTIAALQGLVNQEDRAKIFLLNMPTRIFWDMEQEGGPVGISATEMLLNEGVFPAPHELVEPAEPDARFPALLWLMEHAGDRVKGYAMMPSIHGDEYMVPNIAGARAAAINACTFESLLPVSPEVHRYLKAQGHDLPIVVDTRGLDNTEALAWSVDRYIDHPKRNGQLLAFYSEFATNTGGMVDYFVATGTFAYFFNHRAERGAKMDPTDGYHVILDHYEQGSTTHFGSVELPHAIQLLEAQGFPPVEGGMVNASATSAFPTNPNDFIPAREPKVLEIDPNGVYVAFHGNDGDTLDWTPDVLPKNLALDPAVPEVPMGWKVQPYLIDLSPPIHAWFTQQQAKHPNIDLVASLNNGGAAHGDEAGRRWAELYANYLEAGNGSMRAMTYFGPDIGQVAPAPPHMDRLAPPIDYVQRGYQSFPDNSPYGIGLIEVESLPFTSFTVGSAFGTPEDLADLVVKVAAERPAGEPSFIVARLGYDVEADINVRRGLFPAKQSKRAMDALRNHPDLDGRTVYFVPLRDLAATGRAYLLEQRGNAPPAAEPGRVADVFVP